MRQEVLQVGDTPVGIRTYQWNPPGWLLGVTDPGLSESIEYTTGRPGDNRGYFNGSPACVTTAARGTAPQTLRRFQYDLLGRLSRAEAPGLSDANFEYDTNGNLTELGGTALERSGGSDRLISRTQGSTTATYTYDPAGSVTAQESSDPAQSLALRYDWFSQKLLDAALGPVAARTTLAVRYGSQSRRIYRQVTQPDGSTSAVLYLRSLKGEPLVEFGSDATTTAYLYGPSGAAVALSGSTPRFISRDYLGSVRAVFDPAQQLLAAYDYAPYGEMLRPPFGQTSQISQYRFVSRELDVTGLYDFRARAYDPAVGAYISPDPKHEFASPYSYVGGNPVRYVDPTGEELITLLLIALGVGAAVGAAAGMTQAVVTIAQNGLSGGEAAGVFFGFTALGAGVAAVSAVIGAGAGAAAGAIAASAGAGTAATVRINLAVGIPVGIAAGSALSAAQSAGEAAMTGGDERIAARNGAIIGAVAGAIGGLLGSFGPAVKAAAASAGSAALAKGGEVGLALTAGFVSGAAAGGVASGLNDHDEGQTFLKILQGAAFGLLSAAGGQLASAAATRADAGRVAPQIEMSEVARPRARANSLTDRTAVVRTVPLRRAASFSL